MEEKPQMNKTYKTYILDGHTPVREDDPIKWARWFETHDRHVAEDVVNLGDQSFRISTVFLGLDHNFYGGSEPVLFETIVFNDGSEDMYQQRYYTWDEALEGHKNLIKRSYALYHFVKPNPSRPPEDVI